MTEAIGCNLAMFIFSYNCFKEPMPLKSHFSYCLLNNMGQNKFVTYGKFEIYAVCLLYAIANERKKAEEISQSG